MGRVTDSAEIAIVGAGIMGLATAHALCRDGQAGRGAVRPRRRRASGDSGRSFSMVRRHYSNAVTARLAMAGTRTIADWEDEVGVADAGYVRCGYLLTVPERLEPACRDNVARLQELGLETRFLAPGEIAAVEPELSTRTASPGAAYEPEGGFADAQKMCLGWFAAAAARGLDHRLGCTVRAVRVQGGRVTGVETDRGFTAAGTVVLATGAWTNDLLRPLGAEQPIELRRLQVIVGRRAPGEPLPSAVCSDAVSNLVVRPDRGRRFCAVAYAGRGRARARRRLRPRHLARLPRRRPPLARRALSAAGASSRSSAASRAPTTSRPTGTRSSARARASTGLYLAVGWSGHGFKLSPAVGEVVAAEVTGRTPPIDVSELRAERFAEGRLLRLAYGPGARA